MNQTMPTDLAENLIVFCENRSHVYTLLARCYEREIDAALVAELTNRTTFESDDAALVASFDALRASLAGCDEEKLEELAVVFDRVFFGMGPRTAQKAFPYESVYTSEGGLMMQDAYSAVLHLYRDAGFAKSPNFTEPEDHLAVELSFMALLCDRAMEALHAGEAKDAEGLLIDQATFLREHLLNWIEPFVADAKASAESGFYVQLAAFTEAFLRADTGALAEVVGE